MFAIQVRESDLSRLDPNHQRATDNHLTETVLNFISKHIVTTTTANKYISRIQAF
jgi:hypothetical protein